MVSDKVEKARWIHAKMYSWKALSQEIADIERIDMSFFSEDSNEPMTAAQRELVLQYR